MGGLALEKGEHVRFDWTGEEPPSNMHDGRAAAALIAMMLNSTTMFSYRFFEGKHINLLELESLISLLRRFTCKGVRPRRLLVLVDSRLVPGAVSKGRSSSRKIHFLLRKMGFWCLAYDIGLELVWAPTWANPAGAPSRNNPVNNSYRSSRFLRPRSSRQFMPLWNWICSVNRCLSRRIQPVNMCEHSNHPGSSTAREQVLLVAKMKPRKPTSEEGCLRLQMSSDCHPDKVENSLCFEEMKKEMRLWTGRAPILSSFL